MAKDKGRQKGAQRHAEGQHGQATHRRFIEQLQEGSNAAQSDESAPIEGNHRLDQDRQQHDEAEKNSEKAEAIREARRGH
ncbi:MAG: hypothetical protein WD801_09930 [Gemmatimonadaceae bacterium]